MIAKVETWISSKAIEINKSNDLESSNNKSVTILVDSVCFVSFFDENTRIGISSWHHGKVFCLFSYQRESGH